MAVAQNENLLVKIPVRTSVPFHHVEGRLQFLIPRFKSRPGKLFGKLLRASENIHVTLDDVGTFIWDQIDGVRNVEKIGVKMEEKFGDRVAPTYERLGLFLLSFEKRGFITFRE